MNDVLEVIQLGGWDEPVPGFLQIRATEKLEEGKILYLPQLAFWVSPEEADLLSPQSADPKSKNISFDVNTGELRGSAAGADRRLKALLSRFAAQSPSLVRSLLPRYGAALRAGRTSFRPVEIRGRASSYRKDDTRLHVDAFPSTPVQGKRILRLFSNINPDAQDRVWRAGEPFEDVAQRFLPHVRKQSWTKAAILAALRITKSRRTAYDHIMLELHNRMKADLQYQSAAAKSEIRFPAGSTWIVFTDQVSHAALSGQHALEQTFYLPVEAMVDQSRSPLRILERLSGAPL